MHPKVLFFVTEIDLLALSPTVEIHLRISINRLTIINVLLYLEIYQVRVSSGYIKAENMRLFCSNLCHRNPCICAKHIEKCLASKFRSMVLARYYLEIAQVI